jgi:flagella basal body P-ring formation protein FlgA
MTRFISIIAFLATAFLTSQVMAQTTPALKPAVSVSSKVVALGDLISNAGAKAEFAVFRAPDLGQTGNVSAQEIIDAAAMHGLTGIDTGGVVSVSVTRVSRTVREDDMRAPLMAALAAQGGLDDPNAVEVTLDPDSAEIHLPVEADGAIRIEDAVWQKERGTFDAALVVRRIDGRDERRAIHGGAVETVPVLIVKAPVARGVQLTSSDVAIERRPKTSARDGMLENAADAVGKEARRALREGHLLHANDLVEPTLVKNNTTVSMVLKSGGLTLTATAQALRDGKKGEAIQVMNVQSKRVLQAVVTGPNEVAVNSPRALVSAAK